MHRKRWANRNTCLSVPIITETGRHMLIPAVALESHDYTGINLDYTLCPAPSDPFAGPHYILHALWSQAVVIAFLTRTYILLISYIVPAKLDLVKSK